jgi:thioredoxin reductase
VPMLDERWVTRLNRRGDGFELRIDDTDSMSARRVVVAAGIGSYTYMPPELDPIAGPLCSHSTAITSLDPFAGRTVMVIGGGASGVELAGLLSRKGATVTVAARGPRIDFCGPPQPPGLWEQLKEPESGLGTGWRSLACVELPMLFYHMPQGFRHMVVRRHLGPAPGWTSREEVERNVTVLLNARLEQSGIRGDHAQVTFGFPDGTHRTVEADHVIAATGFRVDMHRLGFLDPQVLDAMTLADNTPILSPHFETSVPGLFMVGIAAANCFGPLLRFAYGAGFTSRRLSRYLASTAVRQPAAIEAALATA